MGHEDRCRIEGVDDPRQFVDEPRVGALVETGERFIEQHDRRAQTQRPRKTHPPAFASRHTIGAPIEEAVHSDERGGLIDTPAPLARVHAAEPQPEIEIPAHRLSKEHFLLEDIGKLVRVLRRGTAERDATLRLDGRGRQSLEAASSCPIRSDQERRSYVRPRA